MANLAVLSSIDDEWSISCCSELSSVCVVHLQRNCFTTEPVADVIGIAMVQVDSDTLVKQILEVQHEVWIDKVSGVLELEVDVAVRFGVVEVDSQRLLYRWSVQVVDEILWRCWVVTRMSDIVYTTAAERIVDTFNEIPTSVLSFGADRVN